MWLLLLIVLLIGYTRSAEAGTVYVAPVVTLPTAAPVIGLRYTLRIHALEGSGNPSLHENKIIFLGSQFTGLSPTGLYVTGVDVFTWFQGYTDQPSCPSIVGGTFHPGVGALWIGVPDYAMTRRIGIRPLNAETVAAFPRQNGGVDGIPGLTALWGISQQSFTGVDTQVTLLRGETFTAPLDGWGGRFSSDPSNPGAYVCDPLLPPGLYRAWMLTLLAGITRYAFEIAEPDAHADRILPSGAMSIVTEFLEQRGLFVLYLWDVAILQEDQGWLPLRQWRVTYRADPEPNVGWGVKLGIYGGQQVLEVSNDGTDTYAQVGETVELADRSVVAIPTASVPAVVLACLLFVVGLHYRFTRHLR